MRTLTEWFSIQVNSFQHWNRHVSTATLVKKLQDNLVYLLGSRILWNDDEVPVEDIMLTPVTFDVCNDVLARNGRKAAPFAICRPYVFFLNLEGIEIDSVSVQELMD